MLALWSFVNLFGDHGQELPNLSYPLHDREKVINSKGLLILPGKHRMFISAVLANQPVGLTELDDEV